MSDQVKRTPEQDMAKVEAIALKIMEKCLDCPVHDVDATFTPLEAIIRRRLRELAEAETLIGQQKSAIQSMQVNYDKQYNELIAARKQVEQVRREAVFAISKAQTERAEQVRDEADLNGYSRGVADTEERIHVASDSLTKLRNTLYDEMPVGAVDAFQLIKLVQSHIKALDAVMVTLNE
jgi:hypothetical protein